jgi:transcriptional enhancer factor
MDRSMSSRHSSIPHAGYRNSLKPSHSFNGELPRPYSTLGSNIHDTQPDMIHGLSFDMWVSSPQQTSRVDKALHAYTRLQGDQHHFAAPPMPLENLVGWRSAFPHLASLVEDFNDPLDCDIILLEANLELMTDFPPSGSRLGIQLELDFAHPTAGDTFMVGQMEDWTCGTHIYDGGQGMLDTYHELQKSSSTKVKPLFESPWWAKLFTQLTQEKRMAEDSGQGHAADEHTRQFFRSLSAVQELRATPAGSRRMSQYSGDQSKRMAILLWKFRQTRPGEVGTTTWRKLIPPPDRTTTNSPRPPVELPPLSLDSILLSKQQPPPPPPAHNIYQPPPPPQDLVQNGTSQPQWQMYPAHDGVGNMFNTNGAFDFLNTMSREDGSFGDRTSVTSSVLDSYPNNLRPETSQPAHVNGGGPPPVMLNVQDLNSLSHPNLAGYNTAAVGHDSNGGGQYFPSPQQHSHHHNHHVPDGNDNNSNVLHSIFGAGTQPIDSMGPGAGHVSWPAPPPTTTIADDSYSHFHFQPSEHPASAGREPHHPNGLDGLMPPDDLMDKLVGSMPGDMQGAGDEQDGSAAYGEADATAEAN